MGRPFTVPIEYNFMMGTDSSEFLRCRPVVRIYYLALWSHAWSSPKSSTFDMTHAFEVAYTQRLSKRSVEGFLSELCSHALLEKAGERYKLVGLQEKRLSHFRGKSTNDGTIKKPSDSESWHEREDKIREERIGEDSKDGSPPPFIFYFLPKKTQEVLKVWKKMTKGIYPFPGFSKPEIVTFGYQVQSWCERFGTKKVIDLMRNAYLRKKNGDRPNSLNYFLPVWGDLELTKKKALEPGVVHTRDSESEEVLTCD